MEEMGAEPHLLAVHGDLAEWINCVVDLLQALANLCLLSRMTRKSVL